MKVKRAFIVFVTVLVVVSGFASAIGALSSQTETFGITGAQSNIPQRAAVVGPTDASMVGTQTVYAGGNQTISRVGAAVTHRIVQEEGEWNVTFVGPKQQQAHYDYYSSVKAEDGTDLYGHISTISAKDSVGLANLVTRSHWSSSNGVVIANPNRVRDYAGGAQYARMNGHPVLYASTESHFDRINGTLDELGTQNVFVTETVSGRLLDKLTNHYNVNNLSTQSASRKFVNNQTAGTTTLYVVARNHQSLAEVQSAANGKDVMMVVNSTEAGNDIENHVGAVQPDVIVIANQGGVSDTVVNQIRNAGANSVRRVGFDDSEGKLARLALWENNLRANPVVVVDETTVRENKNSVTVRVHVRNIGFSAAENVQVRLPTQDAQYEFRETQPTDANEQRILWTLNLMNDNETEVIEYNVTGSGGEDFQYVPEVVSYQNTQGSSFKGATLFGVDEAVKKLKDRFFGLTSDIVGFVGGIDPIVVAILAGVAGTLGVLVIVGEQTDILPKLGGK